MNNANLKRIVHHLKQTALVIDADGMVNASLLAKQYGRNPIEYIMLDGTQPTIVQVAEGNGSPMRQQWQDSRVRQRCKPEYLRTLLAAGITRHVAGTPGGHMAAAPNAGGNGVYNHDAGLWVHPALAAGLARWLECRGEDWKPSPLADFVKQALAGREVGKSSTCDSAAPNSAADTFADTVDAQTLENLRAMDQILIGGAVSFSERRQTLQTRLEQQARREG